MVIYILIIANRIVFQNIFILFRLVYYFLLNITFIQVRFLNCFERFIIFRALFRITFERIIKLFVLIFYILLFWNAFYYRIVLILLANVILGYFVLFGLVIECVFFTSIIFIITFLYF